MMIDNSRLDHLFRRYRDACPEVEPGVDFLAGVWERIDARHGLWFAFERLGRLAMTASAAICLLLLLLNFVSTREPGPPVTPSYVDALIAEHSAEKTYYTETIRTSIADDGVAAAVER